VTEAARIQAYLRETARGFYESVPLPPFTAFFHPREPLRYFNYAIPDEPVEGDLSRPLAELRRTFRERDRLPRFEYVAEFAPGLAAELEAAGLEVELDAPLMTCPASAIVAPDPIRGLEIVPATENPRAYLAVGREAFGEGPPDDHATAAWLEGRNPRSTPLLGLLDGRPVAVATATPPLDGGRRGRRAGSGAQARDRRGADGGGGTGRGREGRRHRLPLPRLGRRPVRLHAGRLPAGADHPLLRGSGVTRLRHG
jgi:hypothetical protein